MFTGIVEATGVVESIGRADPESGVVRLAITTGLDLASLPVGASIAVDGVCLTAVEVGPGRFAAELGPETLAVTTLGALKPGDAVHLERPLRAGDPLGGHLVAGHVDGLGTVIARRERAGALELDIQAPPEVARFTAAKGSVTIDGVSLTVNAVDGDVFSVTLIPHTMAVTRLGDRPPGARVNLEADLVAKHIDRLLQPYLGEGDSASSIPSRQEIAVDVLRRHGFVR